MNEFIDTDDYRDLLQRFYESRKENNAQYSYRILGEKLGLDASQLYRILQKKQHLPQRCVALAKEQLNLEGRSGEYFDLLIAAARSRSEKKQKEMLAKAYSLRDVLRVQIEDSQLEVLSHWWHPVLRSLLEVTQGRAEAKTLQGKIHPTIELEKVKSSLALLHSLGLIKKKSSGRMEIANPHLTVSGPQKAQAVRNFQKQVLALSAEALDEIPVEQRDISTLTLGVDEECFEDVKDMIKEFRRQVQKRIEKSSCPDRVMQLNVSFFPVSKVEGGSL